MSLVLIISAASLALAVRAAYMLLGIFFSIGAVFGAVFGALGEKESSTSALDSEGSSWKCRSDNARIRQLLRWIL